MRSTWFKVGAAVVAAGALVGGAFVAGGYDVAQTKVDDASVWALQQQGDGRYARVDTALGELDTIKDVPHPNDVTQADGHVLLYSQSYAKMAAVDLAQPASYDPSKPSGLSNTPTDTAKVVHTGDYVAYLSTTGAVRAGRIDDDPANLQAIAAPGGKGGRPFSADTVAIGTDGTLYAYSHTTKSVLRYSLKTSRAVGTDSVSGGPGRQKSTITAVGDTWVLLSPDGTQLWLRGVDGAVSTKVGSGAVLQQPSARRNVAVVASETRLVAFSLKDGSRTVVAHDQSGSPAAPSWNGTKLYAAWVGGQSSGGTLWRGHSDLSGSITGAAVDLDYGHIDLPVSTPNPVFRSNGGAEILNELTSGWVWEVPSGKIVQGSQDWTLNKDKDNTAEATKKTSQRETNPEPPVAQKDSFGVRAGSLVSLPVMLNDYDPNGDVISIVPGSLTGLNPTFGTASIANNAQSVTLQTRPGVSGTASFQYTITDGTAGDGGLKSKQPATVTLTVSPTGSNKAPTWCNGESDDDCLYKWPAVQVAPGASVEVPVLRGWVDPDGDPMFAQAAVNNGQYTVSTSPDGTLVFHAAVSAKQQTVRVPVTISDVNGATAQKVLTVTITAKPQLTVESFGLMTAEGVPLTVDPSSHIRGTTGSPRVVSATLAAPSTASGDSGAESSTEGAAINVDSSGTTFDFVAKKSGSYPVTMTVTDSADKSATATATVRITVVPVNEPLLSTSPVTVFVRPSTDTSVNVFSAVQNPTGRVLLLSNPMPKPAAGASLDVDVVGQSQLRVRGQTGTEGPGLLGTVDYTVSDGTNTPAMTVTGVATVYLLPDDPPRAPVAINDAVTVRAGAQVDIPVLANDIGSNGDRVMLDPSSIQDPSHQGLAFASGQLLRYLAPDKAPSKPIALQYAAYSAGNPRDESTAAVTITILPKDGDRPPQPQTLMGRVAAGATVRIPFTSFGVDPDGDMVTLDRITSQPDSGVAQISADGTSIVYTALADSQGQQQFSYRVRDSEGETGVATVMLGVLNAQADPAPVTFSDYVQVQAGSGNRVVVQPTANDVDPQGGKLALVSVTPEAPKDSALYGVLQRNIASTSSSQVVITATPDARTLTYAYSVRNAQGDVSAGLIVVDVVIGHVPDYPVVVDTVVDAQGLGHLDQGIDVVDGKVSWGSGDISGLKLSLYSKMAGVSVSGDLIKVADVPAAGLLIPFELSGTDFTGQQATTYGFLRVPAASDVILALKSDTPTLKVREGETAHIKDVTTLVSTPPGQILNVQSGKLRTTKTRKEASCSVDAANTLTYDAGNGAPWTDACLLPVKLNSQSEWTIVAVPVEVTPKQPLPELRPASLTASPGQRAITFDLWDMTTWLGHDSLSGLRYDVSYGGRLFSVSSGSHSLTVHAKDSDQPGLEEVAHVTVTGPTGPSATADITLKVGPAPSTRPAGGSTTLSCSESQGESCSKTVVGLKDEVNAYGTPLKAVAVAGSVSGCKGVTFSLAGSTGVGAHWGADAPGGTCTVPFTVEDAQGKRSSSSGAGTLSFELKGYPAAPASVSQVAYSGTSVTLAVTPGGAASSYPALSGFKVYVDGRASVTCDASGACPPVDGLKNGDKHTFQVKAFNGVGESRAAVQTVGWAFAQPVVKDVSAKPVYSESETRTTGFFTVTISNSDSTASSYVVQAGGQSETVPAGSGASVTTPQPLAGDAAKSVDVVVTPVSKFSEPPGDQIGATPASTHVTPVGTPFLNRSGAPYASSDTSIAVSPPAEGNANGSDSGSYLYFAAPQGNDPQCSNTGDNTNIGFVRPPGDDWAASTTPSLTGLTQFERYQVFVCYTNGFGAVEQSIGSLVLWDQSNAPVPSGCTYTISKQATELPDYEYGTGTPDCTSGDAKGAYHLVIVGSQSAFGTPPNLTAKYCDVSGSFCGQSVQVKPTGSSAPFQMQVTGITAACNAPATGASSITVAPNSDRGVPQAGPTVTVAQYDYTTDGTTWTTATGDGTALPAGTTAVRSIHYTITWSQAGFDPYPAATSQDAVTCTTN